MDASAETVTIAELAEKGDGQPVQLTAPQDIALCSGVACYKFRFQI